MKTKKTKKTAKNEIEKTTWADRHIQSFVDHAKVLEAQKKQALKDPTMLSPVMKMMAELAGTKIEDVIEMACKEISMMTDFDALKARLAPAEDLCSQFILVLKDDLSEEDKALIKATKGTAKFQFKIVTKSKFLENKDDTTILSVGLQEAFSDVASEALCGRMVMGPEAVEGLTVFKADMDSKEPERIHKHFAEDGGFVVPLTVEAVLAWTAYKNAVAARRNGGDPVSALLELLKGQSPQARPEMSARAVTPADKI